MNQQALPTPYDILDIPLLPFVVGTGEWILLLFLGALCIFLWKVFRTNPLRRKSTLQETLAVARQELQRFALEYEKGTELKPLLGRISLTLRRTLDLIEGADSSSWSIKELERAIADSKEPELKNLLAQLGNIEKLRFQRGVSKSSLEPAVVISAFERFAARKEAPAP